MSNGGSGTLTVSSGGAVVANIELIGHYSSGNFHVTGGTVNITGASASSRSTLTENDRTF